MRTTRIKLVAGQQKKVSATGVFLTLLSAAEPIDIEVEMIGKAGNPDVMTGIPQGYAEQFVEMFNAVSLTSAIDQEIQIGYAMGTVRVDRSTIINQQATVTDNLDPVALGTSAALALAAQSDRLRLILTADQGNADAIALGGPALTAVNAARWLQPGESYIETDAAPAAVYALAVVAGDKLLIEVA